ALFPTVRRASWRWECQPSYAVDADELNAWLDEKGVADDDRPWLSYIRELHSRGIPFERVRVIDTPLNTYQRWIISTTDGNVAAGEDIRWLARTRARESGMPSYDFYVFDEDRVAFMWFDDAGELTGIEVDDDPVVVAAHLDYRARVWDEATPHGQVVL
ncbi:MAG: DUF6879 family protein, partial [Thermocrispum sp.]